MPEAIQDLISKMREKFDTPQDPAATAERQRRESREEENKRAAAWADFRRNIGRRYHDCTFDTFDVTTPEQSKVVVSLQEWCSAANVESGFGLVFLGPRGVGKDHLAVSCVRACQLRAVLSAQWVDGQQLFAEFRDRITNDETEDAGTRPYIAPDILVISDPAPQDGKLTDFQQGILWRIIDNRYRRLKSTWITANADSEAELCSRLGAALVDRIAADATVISMMGWKSHRRPALVVK